MDNERQQDTRSRRRVLAAAALAPVLAGVPAGARALSPDRRTAPWSNR